MKPSYFLFFLLFGNTQLIIAQVSKTLPGIPQITSESAKKALIQAHPKKLSSYLAAEMYNLSYDRNSLGQYKTLLLRQEGKMDKSPRPALGGAYWLLLGKYVHNENTALAIQYYTKAFEWFDRENISLGKIMAKVAEIEARKSTLNTTTGDTNLIRRQLQLALRMAKEDKAYEMEAIVWNQLSAHWASTQSSDSLLFQCSLNAQKALQKIEGYSLTHVVTFINLSQDYSSFNQEDSSSKYLKKSLYLLKTTLKSNHLTFLCLRELGNLELSKGNLIKAEQYFLQALSILPEKISRNHELAYSSLSKLYSTGIINYQKAFEYSSKQIQVSKELFKERNNKIINELQVQYETKKKEQENAQLLIKNQLILEKNQSYLILIFFISVGLSILGYLVWRLRQLNINLRQANTKIEEFNRTRSYLFGIIAHDLLRPAQALSGVSTLLEAFIRQKEWDQVQDVAVDLAQSANQLQSQSENLIRWALSQKNLKIQTREWVLLENVIEEVTGIFKLYAEWKNISIQTLGSSLEKMVFVDRKGLHLVIRNILDNALKASPEGSSIKVRISVISDQVQLQIQDQGNGIILETLEKMQWVIQNPYQHDKYLKDVGIGTVVIALFSHQNNLVIDIGSQLGKGTQFDILFPPST